jgi:hypothetical protein
VRPGVVHGDRLYQQHVTCNSERVIPWVRRVVVATLVGTLVAGCQSPSVPIYVDRGDESLAALVTGTLAIQDGCLVLNAGETVYLVIWPPGTSWEDASDTVLVDGRIARVGESVTLDGGEGEAGPVNASDWIVPPSEHCLAIGKVWKAFHIVE